MESLYLVTGAAGHLGGTLARLWALQGKQVRALVLPGDHAPALAGTNVEIVYGDVCDVRSLAPFFQTETPRRLIVAHAAGVISIASKYDQRVYDVNVVGTSNVLAWSQRMQAERFLYVSSVHAIPEKPLGEAMAEVQHFDAAQVRGLYARTKAEAAQRVMDAGNAGFPTLIVHPSGILGPGDYGRGHLTQMVRDYLSGHLAACVAGGYDMVDVRDVVAGIDAAIAQGTPGNCYILSGAYCSIPDLMQMLHEVSGRRRVPTVLPTWFAKATAPLAEAYYRMLRQPPLFTQYSLETLASNALFSHEKATRVLDYHPRPLIDTLRDMVAWELEWAEKKKSAT